MRTVPRLQQLKKWAEENLCQGRMMKAPGKHMHVGEIVMQEPKCYLAWMPARPDETGNLSLDVSHVTPGIIIMPKGSYAKRVEEKRFDRYSNVHRPKELGQELAVDILFSVYEPGIRMPGFIESVEKDQLDMSLIQEGTEEGLFTLLNWMDDCKELLIGQRSIPGTDLSVDEESIIYSLYTDQSFVVDKRPIYYGFITVGFNGYAEDGHNKTIEQYL